MTGAPRYPGYDVLAKRDTPSWNDRTRAVIDARLATPVTPRFLTAVEWATADALCRRIVPGETEVPLVALLDAKLLADDGDGTREENIPYMREAWRLGLAALDREGEARGKAGFAALAPAGQDAILSDVQAGRSRGRHWRGLDPQLFFKRRVLVDVPALFYSLPGAWSEIGFGGPAAPRGYVRLDGDRRDAWEAAEVAPDGDRRDERRAERNNRHVV